MTDGTGGINHMEYDHLLPTVWALCLDVRLFLSTWEAHLQEPHFRQYPRLIITHMKLRRKTYDSWQRPLY